MKVFLIRFHFLLKLEYIDKEKWKAELTEAVRKNKSSDSHLKVCNSVKFTKYSHEISCKSAFQNFPAHLDMCIKNHSFLKTLATNML